MDNIITLIEESGLNEERQSLLKSQFQDFIDVATKWNEKAKEIKVTDSSQVDLMKLAKEGRLILRSKRTDIEKVRKEIKEQPLRECQAIDKVAKALTELITPTEEYLKEQEEFAKREEEARLQAIISERRKALEQYGVDCQYLDLGSMPQPMFEMMVKSSKFDYEEKIRLENEAEQKRLAEMEAERIRLEEQRKENERLRKLAEEQQETLRIEREKAEAERKRLVAEKEKELEKQRIEAEVKEKAIKEEFAKKQQEFYEKQQQLVKEEKAKEKKLKVIAFFKSHEADIFSRFHESSGQNNNKLNNMIEAYNIIVEITSKSTI
jgi:hypothetical protein